MAFTGQSFVKLEHFFRPLIALCQLLGGLSLFVLPNTGYTETQGIQNLSFRARISEKTVLGKKAPEDFKEYDLSAIYDLPWKFNAESFWGLDTRLMGSIGYLRGAGENALVVSLIPELTMGSEDGRFILDVGVGGALLSRHQFGSQDFGGSFQFALTLGVIFPLYKQIGLGYRFLHYSDARIHGSGTTGADFHMIELSYRL